MTSFKANQQRGSWIAKLETGFVELDVDRSDPYVAVVIEDANGIIDWQAKTYTHRPPAEMGSWWSLPSSNRWRELMESGKPILLRRGMDTKTKTAGPKVAFFKIQNVVFNEKSFSFDILKRVGDCS